MAFIFTMRSPPVSGMNRRDPGSPSVPLPPIDEDGSTITPLRSPPPVPPRAWNRPAHKVFGLGAPPRLNFEGSPPEYSQFDSTGVEGPNGEKLSDVRKGIYNNRHIAKRGGWKRLALIALIAALCIVGLVVGLVVGLRNKNNSSNNSSGSNSSGGASGSVGGPTNPTSNATFPAGSYSIETYLDTVSTNCTSNSATWTCYPYMTYASSPSGSAATFDWIITPVEGTNDYTVSSTPNYFSLIFANASMSLMNAGSDQEHYFFEISLPKPVKPATALTSSNVAATCYFNQTMFQASLYTRMSRTYPDNSTERTNTTQEFTSWPYAVKIEQISDGGAGTPTCLDPSGNSLGDFSVSNTAQQCDCTYLNTGT